MMTMVQNYSTQENTTYASRNGEYDNILTTQNLMMDTTSFSKRLFKKEVNKTKSFKVVDKQFDVFLSLVTQVNT